MFRSRLFRAALKSESLDSAGITIAAQHSQAACHVPRLLAGLRQLYPDQKFRIRSDNRAESVALPMRGEAEILVTDDTPQLPSHLPAPLARRRLLGHDDLMLVASPALHKALGKGADGARVPMLCYPPDSFFGQAVRADEFIRSVDRLLAHLMQAPARYSRHGPSRQPDPPARRRRPVLPR
jgi:DNA-binding transcriptional LysR family regulator